MTVFFAAWQTKLAHAMGETEVSISKLESQYYDVIGTYSQADPYSKGFVSPRKVSYVTSLGSTGLTRVDR
jgi:hypothetical protein